MEVKQLKTIKDLKNYIKYLNDNISIEVISPNRDSMDG